MKKMNKKGFTIVELVIVIAVIAILAGVLIPTFASLVNKANLSADQQAARQMNVVLAAAGKAGTIDEAVNALEEGGYNAAETLVPVSKGHAFFWYQTYNIIVLVNTADNTIVFPTDAKYAETFATDLGKTGADQVLFDLKGEEAVKYIDVVAKDATSLESFLMSGYETIKLEENVKLENQVAIPAGAKVTLDLNGKTLTSAQITGRSKYLDVRGELTVVNGTIEARGIEVLSGGKLVIEKNANVTVSCVDSNGGAAVWVEAGGEVVINGGTFTALNGQHDLTNNLKYNPSVIANNGGKVTINGGTFKSVNSTAYAINSMAGETVINDGVFESAHGVVGNVAGKVTINGGTFTLKAYEDGSFDGHVIWNASTDNVIVVTGGEFNDDRTANKSIFSGSIDDQRN